MGITVEFMSPIGVSPDILGLGIIVFIVAVIGIGFGISFIIQHAKEKMNVRRQ